MPKSYEIYIRRAYTIEIRIQGGINAANGISSIFMVTSVLAVPRIDKVKRDRQSPSQFHSREKDSNELFAQFLDNAVKESEPASMECLNTVYGRDSKMQTFRYQSREYHF